MSGGRQVTKDWNSVKIENGYYKLFFVISCTNRGSMDDLTPGQRALKWPVAIGRCIDAPAAFSWKKSQDHFK
jgi:hypothetical protein